MRALIFSKGDSMQLWKQTICVVIATAAIAAAQQDPPGRVGRLSYMAGSVSLQPAGVEDWVPANLDRPLITGDHLWVDQNSRAEVHIGSAAVRLDGNTAFEFLNLDDQTAQIRLAQGSIEVRVRYFDPNQVFEIDTPNLAFSIVSPGLYRIDANPDGQSTLATVRNGQGQGTGGGQVFPVNPGEQAQVMGDQQVSFNIVGAPAPDWFDNWSDGLDRREDMSASARYCSREMIGYADLDSAGTWRQSPDYGMVWYPQSMPAGWAPYHNGHWAWIDPWGWTWVDDAPWGFAPFHYGRWAYVGGAWGWIPGPMAVQPVYAPALVAFIGGPNFSLAIAGGAGVAWFPLGPHEVYVPAYQTSAGYVNRVNVSNTVVTNVTITNVYNNVNVTNVRYVNQSAPNAVVAVPREAFVGARPVAQAAVMVRPDVMARAQVVRTAAVAPTREAVLGHPTVVASTARPPAAVFARPVVAKTTPPPAPVPFAQKQQLLQQNPGRPLAAAQVQQIRAQSPAPARPAIRPAAQVNMVRQNPAQGSQNPSNFNRPGTPANQAQPSRPGQTPPPVNPTPAYRPPQNPPPANPTPAYRPPQNPPSANPTPAYRPPQNPPANVQPQPRVQEQPRGQQPPAQVRPVTPPPAQLTRPGTKPAPAPTKDTKTQKKNDKKEKEEREK